MTDPSIAIRKADTEDLDRVEALLAANDLPYGDVRTKPGRFFVATSETEFVGAGGLEIYGSNGLLRSIVIKESRRGCGYGTVLCDALEGYARTNEVEALYLLTTTATEFFRRYGYEETVRENVPVTVRQTAEFAYLCPSSATCMKKRLDG